MEGKEDCQAGEEGGVYVRAQVTPYVSKSNKYPSLPLFYLTTTLALILPKVNPNYSKSLLVLYQVPRLFQSGWSEQEDMPQKMKCFLYRCRTAFLGIIFPQHCLE